MELNILSELMALQPIYRIKTNHSSSTHVAHRVRVSVGGVASATTKCLGPRRIQLSLDEWQNKSSSHVRRQPIQKDQTIYLSQQFFLKPEKNDSKSLEFTLRHEGTMAFVIWVRCFGVQSLLRMERFMRSVVCPLKSNRWLKLSLTHNDTWCVEFAVSVLLLLCARRLAIAISTDGQRKS